MFPDTTYTESYFINSFIGGLSAEMQICLFLSEPTILQSAIDFARQQEATIEAASKRNRVFTKSISSHPSVQQKPFPQNPPSPSFNTKAHNYTPPTLQPPRKILSISEMRARREKGLCYNCDEPFTPGHKCKTPHIYLLMTEDEEAAYSSSQVDHTNAEDDVDEAVELSLNAMAGSSGVRTPKVQGFSGKHKLLILIDTGSTHSFISDSLAFKLKCKIQNIIPTEIKVADGSSITCDKQISQFEWTIQGEKFKFPIRLLQLGGFHMVLGCDWLEAISPVEFDYKLRSITFTKENKLVVLHALKKQAECTLISAASLYKMLGSAHHHEFGHIFSLHAGVHTIKTAAPVEDLLAQFSDVFDELQGLPPLRMC